jgi:hypothetical protein
VLLFLASLTASTTIPAYETAEIETQKMSSAELSAGFHSTFDAWNACVKKAADDASVISADPSDLVVKVAFALCDKARGDGEWALARLIYKSKSNTISLRDALEQAETKYSGFENNHNRDLLARVSLTRQIAYQRALGDEIDQKIRSRR